MEQKNNWNWLECIYKSNNSKKNNFIQKNCVILLVEMETNMSNLQNLNMSSN